LVAEDRSDLGSGQQTGDCYLFSGAPTQSFCMGHENYVGPQNNALINFDVADNLPSHVQVLEAWAAMTLVSESTTTAEDVGVWQAAKPWTNLATWDTYDGTNAWSTPGGDVTGAMEDYNTIGTSSDVGNPFYWDIDQSMQGWVDGNPPQVDGLIFEATAGSSAPNTLGFETELDGDPPYIAVYWAQRGGDYPGAKYVSQRLTDRSTLGVNVGTGNLLLSNTDLNLAGVDGLNVSLSRYYNNLSPDQESFGVGWSMGTGADTYLAVPLDGYNRFTYFDGTGNAQQFYSNLAGTSWTDPPGEDVQVSMNSYDTYSSSQFTLLFRHSGITETFTAPADAGNKIAQLSSISDRHGNTIHYHYNASGQLSSIVDTYGNTTTVTYSPAGYVSQITDPTGRTYKYFQNSSGQLTSYQDPAGNTTTYGYDPYGNLTKITTPQGNVVTVGYDAGNTNEVSSVERYVHPSDQSGPETTFQYAAPSGTCPSNDGWTQTSVADPDSHVATYCTDDLDRITQAVDGNGHTRKTSYTQDGYVQNLTSALNIPTSFSYSTDGNDNVTQIEQGSGAGALTEKFSYGDSSNPYLPTQITDPQNNSTTYSYDSSGDPKTITDGLSSQNQAKLTYNTDGTVATSTDADGNQTTYSYTNGNLTTVTPPSGSGLNPINLYYDSANRVIEIDSESGSTGREVEYTYDDFDRITQAVYKNAANQVVATFNYTYDNDGNLIKRTGPAGTTNYTYDGLDRPTGESFPDGTSDSYGYDAASNLTSLTDAGGTVSYGYDKANQLTSVTDPGANTPSATLGYDNDGDLTSTTYASGASVARGYNAEDQLNSLTNTYKTSGGQTAQLSYNLTYDGSLVATSTDQANNLTTYTYDQLNRLTEAKTTQGSQTTADYKYTLDGAGNVLSTNNNGTITTYAYNPGNEICWSLNGSSANSCTSPPSGAFRYSYDPDGNETSNGNNITATYNPLGQTTSITANSTTTNLSYLGESQNELASQGTTTIHNDLLGLASQTTSGATTYFTRAATGQLIDERTPTATYNYLFNPQGSIVGLTNSSGQLENQYSYDPYGNRTTQSSQAPNYYGFQSGYLTTPGYYHYGARYYNPSQLSWTQQDPLTNITSLTQQDRYAFAGGNPVAYSDPTGMCFIVSCSVYNFIGSHVGAAVVTVGGGLIAAAGVAGGAACLYFTDGLESFDCYRAAAAGVGIGGSIATIGASRF